MNRSRFFLRCIAAVATLTVLTAASHAAQKTAKACEAEWTANKAAIQGAHKTKKAFMAECRSGTEQTAATPAAPAAPREATVQPPGNAAPGPAPTPAPSRRAAKAPPATTISAAAGEFASEMEAKAHCPGETVVWANIHSKVYHFAGSRSYGKTKRGAYMCEKDTASAGFRSAKNEKRPQ
ncbi:MAG: hypothetical protein ACLP7P_14910 [Rhodomicrobium sp.]